MKSKGKIIVTGGAGFIGSHLVHKLVSLGLDVIVIDNFSTGKINNLKNIKSKIKILKEDIGNFERLKNQLLKKEKVEYLYHLAALPRVELSIDNPLETHKSNVHGVFGVLELAKFLGVKKLIYTSSSSVYGAQKKKPLSENLVPNPQNPYAAQKLIGEIYCEIYSKVFGIQIVTLRLFNVYGSGMEGEGAYQLVFTKWIEQMEKDLPLTIYGDGKQTRDFTHVSDVIAALIKTMKFEQVNIHEIINIGSGRQVSVKYLASLFKAPSVHVDSRKFEERFKQANIQKADKLLNWKPRVSIEEGVAELLKK